MPSLLRPALAAVTAVFLASTASAVSMAPMIQIFVDSWETTIMLEEEMDPDTGEPTGRYQLPGGTDWTHQEAGDFSITLCGTTACGGTTMFDPDPEMFYFMDTEDLGAPSSFHFVFSQGIVPTAAPGFATHSTASSTTDVDGGGVPVTADFPPAGVPHDGDDVIVPLGDDEIFVYTLSTNGGTTLLTAGLDLRGDFTGPANTSGGPPGLFEFGAPPAGSGSWNYMQVDVSFSMAGGGDLHTWNGHVTIVPEPGTLALMGLGLVGLTVLGRRRH